jgi:hypothetical protein
MSHATATNHDLVPLTHLLSLVDINIIHLCISMQLGHGDISHI